MTFEELVECCPIKYYNVLQDFISLPNEGLRFYRDGKITINIGQTLVEGRSYEQMLQIMEALK